MNKYTKTLLIAGLCSAFVVGGATAGLGNANAATSLADALSSTLNMSASSIIHFNNGMHVGKQGTGGSYFLNGSIANDTTTNGISNALTLADDIRLEGVQYRKEKGGSLPLKYADNLVPDYTNRYKLGETNKRWKAIYATGDIDTEGTLRGGNVTTTGTLNANAVKSSTSISQPVSKEGAAKMGAVIASAGTITNSFENLSDVNPTIVVNRSGTGDYTVDFNTDLSTNNRKIVITPTDDSAAVWPIVKFAITSNNDEVRVKTYDVVTAAQINNGFHILVF
ncbi:MAG: hypothetical protein ACD_51C00355G0001 [uncultured bacterium]|nr:MAG: hypothetical protein ACD_51C00355G0001 [uncultured bacterium]